MSVAVVYAVGSRTIRRVIVSDGSALDHAALSDGEAILEVPQKTYNQSNAAALASYVAALIGEPEHDCRCVEVDKTGKVVAVYSADPAIDKPLLSCEFTLELNRTACLGDAKGNDGKFPPKSDSPQAEPFAGT